MNAIQLTAYGTPAALRYSAVPTPEVKAGEVRIQVHAAAVNPLELKLASGQMQAMMPLALPWIPGVDLAGVVDAVGEGVQGFQTGDAVYASLSGGGAYTQSISLPVALLSHKPESLTYVEAAALAGVAQTAWQALFERGQIKPGQRVLIHGASGGVGTVAIQLAVWKGATVLATASAANADFVRDLGASEVFDSHDLTTLAGRPPVDLVIDAVGGAPQVALYAAVKPGGQLVTLTQPPAQDLAEAHGVQASMLLTQPSGDDLRAFEAALKAGAVRPIVHQTFPLQNAAEAWARQSQPGVRGKLVLLPQAAVPAI